MDVTNAHTLPPDELYTSKELYELELEKVWNKSWMCVAHELELKEPGDYVGIEILGEPIVVVKGDDQKIRALSSVCRHRFMPMIV